MKEYKISYFQLSLVLLGYLIYNLSIICLIIPEAMRSLLFWPIFFYL